LGRERDVFFGAEDEVGDLGGGGVGEPATMDVEWHVGRSLSAGQVDDSGDFALDDDVVGLQVAVCPAGRVEFRQFVCRPGRQGKHAFFRRGAAVTAVCPFELGPQASALDPPQRQPGSLLVPAVVAVELGAEQVQDLAFPGGHEITGDLQRDVVNLVDSGAPPVVQDCELIVGQSETSDDPIHDAPVRYSGTAD